MIVSGVTFDPFLPFDYGVIVRTSRSLSLRLEAATTAPVVRPLPASKRPGVRPGQRPVRRMIEESWQRSLHLRADPDAPPSGLILDGGALEEYRRGHPLAVIMPVIHKLLIQPSSEHGLLVAVGDELGRLLWVDGDTALRRRAERMMFVEGAVWSEASVGTSAPGTALALGRSVQISGAEHFNRAVHPWSCTAVPFHDPDTGAVIGVLDITGTEMAVAPHTLALVEATVAAAQAHLRVERLQLAAAKRDRLAERRRPASATLHRTVRRSSSPVRSLYRNSLQLLGRDQALLSIEGRTVSLSPRHSEMLALLSIHPDGLSAEELCNLLFGDVPALTLRAEMVRLRKVLQQFNPVAVPESRPYRLTVDVLPDAGQVLSCLHRGAHRVALNIYRGPVLPHSEAPGVVSLRERVSTLLREALLADGSAEALLQYADLPEASDDMVVRMAALKLLPLRSPKRAAVVADLERLESEFGTHQRP
ncbi:GAF domain-containing protein [Arthrobacter sp. ISL-5]|nr:GAF domain-containing protein [Arthrobacter sp. ISL-5]